MGRQEALSPSRASDSKLSATRPLKLKSTTRRAPKSVRLRDLPLSSTKQNQVPLAVDGKRFWAVVVGIDWYSGDSSLKLQGACADAFAMYKYLTADLGVPPENIKLLTTEQTQPGSSALVEHPQPIFHHPTRDNILNALYDLRDNSNIRRGDNILFYFAGRGSRYLALPLGVETLCPADRGCVNPESSDIIHDISDRELSITLQEICIAKGDCITVIIDCCHTAGGEALQNVRYAPPLPFDTSELLLSISHPRKRSDESFSSPTWDWDPSSCVLLSAALPYGGAKEGPSGDQGEQYHGYFTYALLELLRHRSYNSYYALCRDMEKYMPRFRVNSQSPTAIGDRRHSKPWFTSEDASVQYVAHVR